MPPSLFCIHILLELFLKFFTKYFLSLNSISLLKRMPALLLVYLVFLFHNSSVVFEQSCFVVVQSLSHVQLFVAPWTAAHQALLSFTISQSMLKHISIELVVPYNHLILCLSLLPLSSVFPSIRVFANESALCTSWPK